MDLGFFRRAQMIAQGRRPAQLDYGVLVATLQALQIASPAARAVARSGEARIDRLPKRHDALVEVILGGARWQEAVLAQGGSFHPGCARPGAES